MMRLLIDERPLMVQPSLVKLLGSIERAVVLQQIHWLLQQPKTGEIDADGNKWVWGTLQEWCDDYFQMWGARQLKRHISHLRDCGYLIVEKRDPSSWDKTNKYRVNYDKLESAYRLSDVTPSKGTDVTPSKGTDVTPSKGTDVTPSYIRTETSTETSTEKKGTVAKQSLPAWLNKNAWDEFVQHRREIRKPLTQLAARKAMKTLEGLSHEQQQSVIDKSIQSRWAGLFPEKNRNTVSNENKPRLREL